MNKDFIHRGGIFLINIILLFLFSTYFSNYIVIANKFIGFFTNLLWLSFLLLIPQLLLKKIYSKFGLKLTLMSNDLTFLMINTSIFIWFYSKIPTITGIGISNFYWAIILGSTLSVFVWWYQTYLQKK